jgi:hypothetical protein
MKAILEHLRSPAMIVAGRRRSMLKLRLLLAAISACALWLGVASAAHAVRYSDAGTISINDATSASPKHIPAKATPYPAGISVSGLTGPVTKVTATLHGFHHTCPTDVDFLLVGPQGQKTLLMSDAGDCNRAASPHDPIDLTFDDGGPPVPCLGGNPTNPPLAGGTYAPTNSPMSAAACYWDNTDPDVFDAPAPTGPYPASMAVFNGVDPNGSWQLYVMDQFSGDQGAIDRGWSLDFTVPPPTVGAPNVNSGGSPSATSKPTSGVGPPIVSTAGTKKTQRVLKRGGLVVLAKSNIAGRLIAGATLSIPNASKTYRFKSVRKTLAAGVKTSAKLKLPKRGLSAVRNALNRGQKLKAELRLTVTDSSGGKTTKNLSIWLRK